MCLNIDKNLALRSELDRVAQQVDENLPQARSVADHFDRGPIVDLISQVERFFRSFGRKQV